MLRVGFLGCGETATRRACSMRALNEETSPLFEFTAACDLAPARSAYFVSHFGGNAYSSVGRMLSEAELDALIIATPPGARGPAENAALAAGVALWIEPPIAATIRTANALALQIKKSGVPVMVCAPHRYSPELERLKRTLAAKTAPHFDRWNADVNADLLKTAWREEAKNGTIWLDAGWPLLDLLRFLGVEANKTSAKSNLKTGVATLELRSGGLASLGVSRFATAHELLSAQGEECHLQVENWTTHPRIELRLKHETTLWQSEDASNLQLRAFARLLSQGKRTENRSPFPDALLTLKLGLEMSKTRL